MSNHGKSLNNLVRKRKNNIFRYDRDDYIDITWVNVINGADDQFEKYGMNVIDQMNEPYDYSSIMHYGPYAFSSNGKKTIIARKPGAGKMGQRIQFSDIDLRKINKLYQCSIPATNNNGNINANTAPTINTSNTKKVNKPTLPFLHNRFIRPIRRWGPNNIIPTLG